MLCITVALLVARFFGAVWATLASLWENVVLHGLPVVHASMFTLRYGKFGGVRSLHSPDILVLGHLCPSAWLVCRILAGGCSGVNGVTGK